MRRLAGAEAGRKDYTAIRRAEASLSTRERAGMLAHEPMKSPLPRWPPCWLVILLAAVLQPSTSASAQAPPDPGRPVTSSAATALSLTDGHAVILRNLTRLSSATSKVGDQVEFEVIRPVSVDGLVVIPEHAIATGKVVNVVQKKSKGRGGQVAVGIEGVAATNGQPLKLRGQSQHAVHAERGKDIAALEAQTLGFGVAIIPVILLQRGPDMVVEPGTRFEAFIAGEQALDREALERAQASLRAPRQDVAVVYLYRRLDNQPKDIDHWPATCGEAYIGTLDRGRYIRLELPDGRYWLGYGLGVDMSKADPAKFFQLPVERGHTYYVRHVVDRIASWTKGAKMHLEMVDEAVGADEVVDLLAPAAGSPARMTSVFLQWAQRQPTATPKVKKKD